MSTSKRIRFSTKSDDASTAEWSESQDEEKDDAKRQCRNLSEKKRRNSFNVLLGELLSLLDPHSTKMDKASILRNTIELLRKINTNKAMHHDIEMDWKPPSLTNEEFLRITLESLNGFVIFFSESGSIIHLSEEAASSLNCSQSLLMKENFFDLIHPNEVPQFRLWMSDRLSYLYRMNETPETIFFDCNIRCRTSLISTNIVYRPVSLFGISKPMNESIRKQLDNRMKEDRFWLACVGRLVDPLLHKEIILTSNFKPIQFTTKHNFDWNILYADNKSTGITGYLPYELLGVSAFKFYHPDDLNKINDFLKRLKNRGETVSFPYRFLLKNLTWVWLQTKAFITYNQWTSKPEYITAINCTVSYDDLTNNHSEPDILSSDVHSSYVQSSSSANAPPNNNVMPGIVKPLLRCESTVTTLDDQSLCHDAEEKPKNVDALKIKTKDDEMESKECGKDLEVFTLDDVFLPPNAYFNAMQSSLLAKLKSKHNQLQLSVQHQFDQLKTISHLIQTVQGQQQMEESFPIERIDTPDMFSSSFDCSQSNCSTVH